MFHCPIRTGWIAAALAVAMLPATSARAQHHEGQHHADSKVQKDESTLPKCPVMGDPVDISVKTMTAEGPVYFCCKDCIKKYEKNPANYAKAVAEQRRVLADLPRVQVSCPVSGKPVNAKAFVQENGKKVFFCCKNCMGKYQSEPEKYKTQLLASYTYQTKCPVSGEPIDPISFITLKAGQTIYFCCNRCDKKFLKDPAKYEGRLSEQGTRIDVKKVERAQDQEDKNEHDPDHDEPEGHDPAHDHDH